MWKDGKAQLTTLDKIKRTPLVSHYLTKDHNGQSEPAFHLCDEPFDYSAWKTGKPMGYCSPSIEQLGYDRDNNVVTELTLPKRDNVYVEVLNKKGEIINEIPAASPSPCR